MHSQTFGQQSGSSHQMRWHHVKYPLKTIKLS